MKWHAMLDPTDLGIALYIRLIFVVFICGLFLGAKFRPEFRPKEREPWYAQHITAKGGLGRDGTCATSAA